MPGLPSFLYLSDERALYRGPLGQPSARTFGAVAWYISTDSALSVTLADGQACQEVRAVCVPAGVSHHVKVSRGHVICYLVELEFANVSAGQAEIKPGVAEVDGDLLARMSLNELRTWLNSVRRSDGQLDRLVLGQELASRCPDPRMAEVVRRIREDPSLAWQAADAAAHCGLSASRFMHAFKAEIGVGWRAFRSWKRARALLACVHTCDNLTQLALSLGYPDATHFSHAIRQITGLRPSDIVAGSRELSVWNESGVSPD